MLPTGRFPKTSSFRGAASSAPRNITTERVTMAIITSSHFACFNEIKADLDVDASPNALNISIPDYPQEFNVSLTPQEAVDIAARLSWLLIQRVDGNGVEATQIRDMANHLVGDPQQDKPRWKQNGTIIEFPISDSYSYDIDLSTITTPAQALDWIFHISEKNWGEAALPGLVAALSDHTGLRNPALRG